MGIYNYIDNILYIFAVGEIVKQKNYLNIIFDRIIIVQIVGIHAYIIHINYISAFAQVPTYYIGRYCFICFSLFGIPNLSSPPDLHVYYINMIV